MSVLLFTAATLNAQAADTSIGGKRDLTTMTYNLYIGADLDQVLLAETIEALIAAVTEAYYEMLTSDPPARLEAIANEIALRKPDLVAIQEVSTVLVQSPGDWLAGGTSPAEDLVVDFLDLLLDSLEARGAHYTVAAVVTEWDVELPMLNPYGSFDDARIIDREAILVRSDLPPGYLRTSNPQSGHFQSIVQVPELGIAVKRGWCSVDVSMRGRTFRYVCAHPEPAETLPELNYLQIAELLEDLSTVTLPVILAGDLNTDPLQRDGSFSYSLFGEAGFVDTWSRVNPANPEGGLTYGHDYELSDPNHRFSWRIDLVMYRGDRFAPAAVEVVDPLMPELDPPWWPSDHAGVHAELRIW
jgi:endonuclease/exonuclease/phosphatase family metal-dependent hydrolase